MRSKIEEFDIDSPYEHDKLDLAKPGIYKWMNENHDDDNIFSIASRFLNPFKNIFWAWNWGATV